MQFINFTGDFSILKKKGFMTTAKDPFEKGTLGKAIGNGFTILIRQNREIRMCLGDFIYPAVDKLKITLDKMEIPYEIVGEPEEESY